MSAAGSCMLRYWWWWRAYFPLDERGLSVDRGKVKRVEVLSRRVSTPAAAKRQGSEPVARPEARALQRETIACWQREASQESPATRFPVAARSLLPEFPAFPPPCLPPVPLGAQRCGLAASAQADGCELQRSIPLAIRILPFHPPLAKPTSQPPKLAEGQHSTETGRPKRRG